VLVALFAMIGLAPTPANAGARGDEEIAPGFVTGREHEVRIRPVLADVPAEAKKIRRAARTTGEAAVASCDPAQVTELGKQVPTTPRDGDDPAACVVLPVRDGKRALLGPAPLTGSEIGRVVPSGARKSNLALELDLATRGHTLWTFFSAEPPEGDLAFTLDGEVIDLVALTTEDNGQGTSFTLGGRKGYPADEANELERLAELAKQEEVIELARESSMSRRARELYAANNPAIEEKGAFASDCPLPEADEAFVLGCYDSFTHAIAVLRIDRVDIIGGMPVTAAHEMLHAANDGLTPRKREQVDTMVDEFVFTTPQPQLADSLSLYSESERSDELHSILGTEIRTLSPDLERYYARYFDDRSVVVTLSEGFARVFDDLENRYDQLDTELNALEGQIESVESQAVAAGNEADRLSAEIDSLLAQGRIDESNALVGPQNAAVDRANSLVGQYNALVSQYNAKVSELNAIAESLGELYRNVTVEPIV